MSFWTSKSFRAKGSALVDPFDPTHIVNCAYELTVGAEGYVTGTVSETKVLLAPGEQLVIPPGQFALLLTNERVTIPNDAIGFISIRTSFKLQGLINVSGFHVDPGFTGKLIFSVYNAGGSNVHVSRGDRLFLLWLATLEEPTEDTYEGTHGKLETLPSREISAIGPQHYSPAEVNDRLTQVEVSLATALNVGRAILVALVVGLLLMGAERYLFNDDSPPQTPVQNVIIEDSDGKSPGILAPRPKRS